MEPAEKDSPLLQLQKERARERALRFGKSREVFVIGLERYGEWKESELAEHMKELRALWENLDELTTRPDEKLKCAESRVAAMKEFEKFISGRVDAGRDPSQSLDFAKAARLDAEIELLKLKESLQDKK
jgi:hypothetical protein